MTKARLPLPRDGYAYDLHGARLVAVAASCDCGRPECQSAGVTLYDAVALVGGVGGTIINVCQDGRLGRVARGCGSHGIAWDIGATVYDLQEVGAVVDG